MMFINYSINKKKSFIEHIIDDFSLNKSIALAGNQTGGRASRVRFQCHSQ